MTDARTLAVHIDYGDHRLTEQFWSKVYPEPNTGCWLWGASLNPVHGYGQIKIGGRSGKLWRAHRLAYLALVADVAADLHLDHLCRNRTCVNPAHLEPVTGRVNILRGTGASARNAKKTHCVRGHEFSASNTAMTKHGRRCKKCHVIHAGIRQRRLRAEAKGSAA